jgi:hypothetical protein
VGLVGDVGEVGLVGLVGLVGDVGPVGLVGLVGDVGEVGLVGGVELLVGSSEHTFGHAVQPGAEETDDSVELEKEETLELRGEEELLAHSLHSPNPSQQRPSGHPPHASEGHSMHASVIGSQQRPLSEQSVEHAPTVSSPRRGRVGATRACMKTTARNRPKSIPRPMLVMEERAVIGLFTGIRYGVTASRG